MFSTGYIAGGTIAGVLIAFLSFSDALPNALAIGENVPAPDHYGRYHLLAAGGPVGAGGARMDIQNRDIIKVTPAADTWPQSHSVL